MSQTRPEPDPEARVRSMQFVVGVEAASVLVFFIVALALRSQGQFGPPPAVPLISYVMIAFAAAASLASVVVPGISLAAARRKLAAEERAQVAPTAGADGTPSPRWYGLRLMNLTMHVALLAGPAFCLLVAYLVEGRFWTALLALLFLPAILAHFPTRPRVEAWVERQRSLARQEQEGTF
jgi:hypothetical protein